MSHPTTHRNFLKKASQGLFAAPVAASVVGGGVGAAATAAPTPRPVAGPPSISLNVRDFGVTGDGLDLDSCQHVLVEDCDISIGDDCISLKSGRGLKSYALRRTAEDVVIRHCTFADSIFACIGIAT